jgi:hypothetical protein
LPVVGIQPGDRIVWTDALTQIDLPAQRDVLAEAPSVGRNGE